MPISGNCNIKLPILYVISIPNILNDDTLVQNLSISFSCWSDATKTFNSGTTFTSRINSWEVSFSIWARSVISVILSWFVCAWFLMFDTCSWCFGMSKGPLIFSIPLPFLIMADIVYLGGKDYFFIFSLTDFFVRIYGFCDLFSPAFPWGTVDLTSCNFP